MANARQPSGNTPTARIGIDLSAMQGAANVARQAGQATAREINAMFQSVRTSQQLAIQQSRQATSTINAQNAQLTATARAESQVRVQQARAESIAHQQAARTSAQVAIEQERRKTAAFNAEIRARQQAERQGGSGQGLGQFAGAALGGIGGPAGSILGGLAGGTPAIAAGLAVSQGARAAIEASQVATAYDRQRVAAVNLAGSQARLNQLLSVYDRATGGAIDNAQALADVTKLMSVGFADSSEELDHFSRAIRGISTAMGMSQDTVTQNLILELFTQRGMRLDQLGLQYDKVRQRADELRAADASLTQQQAYQNAVLEQANQRFGKLADTVEGQATGIEKLTKTWRDFRLEIGQEIKPNLDGATNDLNDFLNLLIKARQENQRFQQDAVSRRAAEEGRIDPNGPAYSRTSIGRVTPTAVGGGASGAAGYNADQVAALRARSEGAAQIERDASRSLLEERRSYENQNASIIKSYQKATLREAEDFGRQRANAERKLQMSILDVAQDSARQRVKWETELARGIARAQADSAEKVQGWERERAERIADARADSAEKVQGWETDRDKAVADQRAASLERVAKLEEDYQEAREQAAKQHSLTMMNATSRLDAVTLWREQAKWELENAEAKEAHAEKLADEEVQLQKEIDQINEAHQERLVGEARTLQKAIDQANRSHERRLEDEAKALEKSILQQQETHQMRLDEQAENDRLRIQEMKDAFEEQKAQEDIERGIRLGRQAQDHNDQLTELGRQHSERIQQIKDQAQEQRDQFKDESNKFLEEVGIHNAAWLREQERINNGVIKLHEQMLEAERRNLTPGHPSLADPYVDRQNPYASPAVGGTVNVGNNSSVVTIAPNITINESSRPRQTAEEIEQIIRDLLAVVG